MSLFKRKKRIDTVEYWKSKIDYLFSEKYEKAFQLLLNTKSDLFTNASKTDLKDHIIAAYIELVNITVAKNNVSRDKRYEIAFLKDDYIKSKNGHNIIRLVSDYNKEFGSSMSDGIRPMAKYFSHSIETNNSKELEKFIYELFYAVLNESFAEIRSIKLV